MQFFLLGLLVLVAVLWALRGFTNANAAVMARQLRFAGGILALAVAAVLFLRGMAGVGMLIGMVGWGLLRGRGVTPWGAGGWGRTSQKSAGQSSRVVTDHLEVELDHDTGAITGRVVKGMFSGRMLESMTPADLALLWQDCRFGDAKSMQILEAYLDRLHPSWRDDMARGEQELSGGPDGRMTPQQAYEILGLEAGAGEEDIRRAHRELMMKVHPDRGGSNYLASKINEAKDVLLGI